MSMETPILPLAGRGCNAAHAGARRPTRGRGRLGDRNPLLQFFDPSRTLQAVQRLDVLHTRWVAVEMEGNHTPK